MLIAISGTPGTGKTAVAKILAGKLNAKLITTQMLVRKYKIKTRYDKKRRTEIIDEKKLAAAAGKEAKNYESAVFESHMAHFASANTTIILRTSPQELERRLRRKGWGKKKVRENVEAEALGIISGEAATNALEMDTTKKPPKPTAALIVKLLNSYSMQKRHLKKIDWSEQYARYLRKA